MLNPTHAMLFLLTVVPLQAQWQRVQQLPADTPIAILEQGRSYPAPCRMDWSDDHTLACITATPSFPPRTLVFPITSVAAVYLEELSDAPNYTAMLVIASTGAGLGAALCRETPAATILVCAALGATIGAGTVAGQQSRFPPRPHIVRHRIYFNPHPAAPAPTPPSAAAPRPTPPPAGETQSS